MLITHATQHDSVRTLFTRWLLDGCVNDVVMGITRRATVEEVMALILRYEHRYGAVFAAIQAAQPVTTAEPEQPQAKPKPAAAVFDFAAAPCMLAQRIHTHVSNYTSSAHTRLELPSWEELCAAVLPADVRDQPGTLIAIKLVCAHSWRSMPCQRIADCICCLTPFTTPRL
jgi:hypothetical protein